MLVLDAASCCARRSGQHFATPSDRLTATRTALYASEAAREASDVIGPPWALRRLDRRLITIQWASNRVPNHVPNCANLR